VTAGGAEGVTAGGMEWKAACCRSVAMRSTVGVALRHGKCRMCCGYALSL
jgi:hypothetical protein